MRSRFKRHVACGLLVVFAVGLALLGSTRFTAHAGGATLKLSPSSGHPSAYVSVSGVAFGSHETVFLAFDATSAGTGTTESTGACKCENLMA